MKDLIFVTAYCPTEEQVLRLDQCVESLQIDGFDLCLVSHSHVPLYIQKKCKYYIYDHLNDLEDDDELKHSEFLFGEDYVLQSKLLKKTPFYGYAIYRMFSIVSQLAINYGYEKIYHVEYDYIIKDSAIFTNHKNFLDEWDSVFYGKNTEELQEMIILGGLKSFRVDKLPSLFKNYNRDLMGKRMKEEKLIPLENFTMQLFSEAGNPLFIDQKHLKNRIEMKKFIHQELNWTIYLNISNGCLGFFLINYFDPCIIKISINDGSEEISVTFVKNEIKCIDVKEVSQLKNIKIIRDSSVILETDVTEELIEKLKLNSVVVLK